MTTEDLLDIMREIQAMNPTLIPYEGGLPSDFELVGEKYCWIVTSLGVLIRVEEYASSSVTVSIYEPGQAIRRGPSRAYRYDVEVQDEDSGC